MKKNYLDYLTIEELKKRKEKYVDEVKDLYQTLDMMPKATYLGVLSIKSMIKHKEKHIEEIDNRIAALKNERSVIA